MKDLKDQVLLHQTGLVGIGMSCKLVPSINSKIHGTRSRAPRHVAEPPKHFRCQQGVGRGVCENPVLPRLSCFETNPAKRHDVFFYSLPICIRENGYHPILRCIRTGAFHPSNVDFGQEATSPFSTPRPGAGTGSERE